MLLVALGAGGHDVNCRSIGALRTTCVRTRQHLRHGDPAIRTYKQCMLVCVRTTVNLPDALFLEVKHRAAQRATTVTSLLEEALRDLLVKEQNVRQRRPLPTDGEPNGRLLVDLLDADALADALDADRLR